MTPKRECAGPPAAGDGAAMTEVTYRPFDPAGNRCGEIKRYPSKRVITEKVKDIVCSKSAGLH
jgi:hypothetical protein